MLASQVKIDFRPAPYIFIRNYNDNKNYAYNQKNQDTFLCEKILSLKARGGEIRPLFQNNALPAFCPIFAPSVPPR